jgi:hypothetical protein
VGYLYISLVTLLIIARQIFNCDSEFVITECFNIIVSRLADLSVIHKRILDELIPCPEPNHYYLDISYIICK